MFSPESSKQSLKQDQSLRTHSSAKDWEKEKESGEGAKYLHYKLSS